MANLNVNGNGSFETPSTSGPANTTGGVILKANASGYNFLQFVNNAGNAQWGYFSVSSSGELIWNGSFNGSYAIGNPPGTIIYTATPTAPSGYIKANGAAISRTSYSALFTTIGTTFGAGDGSTTFNIPDLRGEFIRGWDDGRMVDASAVFFLGPVLVSRTFGSFQAEEIKSHKHVLPGDDQISRADGKGGWSASYADVFNYDANSRTDIAGGKLWYTSSIGGPETRPRNVALLACIKF